MARSAEVIAEYVREEIFQSVHLSGTPLREAVLCKRFDISRRTAREALLILADEGLVIHRHNQGASVRTFDTEDIKDLYRIRRVLEVEGARQATLASVAQLNHISTTFEEMRKASQHGLLSSALAQADVAFHASIIALIGSPGIDRFFKQTGVQSTYALLQLQRHDAAADQIAESTVLEHQAIHDAVVRRDVIEAQRLILEHIQRHEQTFLEALRTEDSGKATPSLLEASSDARSSTDTKVAQ